jgi:hypothetical protein
MSDNRDEKLDNLLRSRRVEPASPDLAQRIVQMAQQHPQNKRIPLWQWLGELFGEFHLPKPAYVLASALVFGMMIGYNVPQATSLPADDGAATIQSFLSADETLL